MTYDEYKARRRTVETPAGTFAYLDVGEGPPVLFLHGLFVSAYMWHHVIDELKADRRCLAYNLPAHGGTEVPEDQPLTLDANVELLESFCQALELDDFDLVANDTGGALAQAFTVRHPDQVRTLALTNCEARDWMPSHDDLAQMVTALARQGGLAPALKAGYDDLDAARKGPFAAPYQWPERLTDDEIRGIMEPHQATLEGARRLERFARSLEPEQLAALEPALRELRVPTVAVWGTADTVFPLELAHWLRDTIPSLHEVIEIEGGKLFWPFERGAELVPPLRRHWERATSRVGSSA
jgi:pimeloyl-ACP methyl ester carboxylesterase